MQMADFCFLNLIFKILTKMQIIEMKMDIATEPMNM